MDSRTRRPVGWKRELVYNVAGWANILMVWGICKCAAMLERFHQRLHGDEGGED